MRSAMAARTAAASRGIWMVPLHPESMAARAAAASRDTRCIMQLQLQHVMPCIARRLPTRWQHALGTRTALSSTAALDSAASAWHVMPCITRRLPTSWQRALGTRAALSSTVAQQLHSVMQLQHGILCHALLDGYPHKVAASAGHSCRA